MSHALRELGILSARYAEEEEEASRSKQRVDVGSTASLASSSSVPSSPQSPPSPPSNSAQASTSTIVSAPIPPAATQRVLKLVSSSTPSSIPGSPLFVQSPPNTQVPGDNSVPASLLHLLAAHQASLPSVNKIQQLGFSFMPMAPPFTQLPTSQGLLMSTPMGLTAVNHLASALPPTVVAAPQQYQAPVQCPPAPAVEVFSSLSSSRIRKPFHKRRPAHMDKNMLFCHFCGRKDTPEWRKGPSGPATLCNACGLQWAKKVRAQRSSAPSTSTSMPNKAVTKAEDLKVEN